MTTKKLGLISLFIMMGSMSINTMEQRGTIKPWYGPKTNPQLTKLDNQLTMLNNEFNAAANQIEKEEQKLPVVFKTKAYESKLIQPLIDLRKKIAEIQHKLYFINFEKELLMKDQNLGVFNPTHVSANDYQTWKELYGLNNFEKELAEYKANAKQIMRPQIVY